MKRSELRGFGMQRLQQSPTNRHYRTSRYLRAVTRLARVLVNQLITMRLGNLVTTHTARTQWRIMTSTPNNSDDAGSESGRRISRRSVLKAAGAGAAGIAVIPGSASAHGVFYGCSQVCTHEDAEPLPGVGGSGRKAVVYNTETEQCECRPITATSNRNDPRSRELRDIDPNDNVYCYEVAQNETIVGICTSSGFNRNDNLSGTDSTSNGRCVHQDCSNVDCSSC